MSYAAIAQDDDDDRYYTQVEAGDVRLFTLDQLDAAFNAGLIHENTFVCLEGDSKWLTLAEVAGLGDEEPEPVSGPQPVPYRAAPPQRVAPVPYNEPYSSPYYVPPSIAPVSHDLSLDDSDFDMMRVRPKRRLGKVMAFLTVCALGALGFMVVQSGGLRGVKLPPELAKLMGQSAAASLSLPKQDAQPVMKELPRAPAEAPKPEPVKVEEPKPADPMPVVATSESSSKTADKADPKADERFSDEMKEALLNKDKKQASKQKGKKAARAAIAAKGGASKANKPSTGFKSGGSAYDPLNGKL